MKIIDSQELGTAVGDADEISGRTASDSERDVAIKPLENLVRVISADASSESMKYLLRSDTGHDGE